MNKIIIPALSFLFFLPCSAQVEKADSSINLDEVVLRAFEQNRKNSSATALVKVIDNNNGDRYNKTSLVNGFNSIAGVRMEERSPGSYRINIRGSSLRSPFGVRNVKVYWNEIPVTDPGGNTYFNQFAWNNFSHIEIYKGPAGSLYGAGTGGLILMHTLSPWQPGVSAEYVGGSYNLQNIFASVRYGKNENMNQLSYAHNQSDGYRVQSQVRRDNFSWISKLKISDQQQFTASLLFSDLYYQTPGALTLAEFKANPKAARPSAGGFPSAVDAKAAIKQMNFLAGFSHFYKLTDDISNQTTFYGSFAEIRNPAIRNYERRSEPSFGGRTVFTYEKKDEHVSWQFVGGSEFQHGFFNTLVFKNVNGGPDSLRTNDDIVYNTTIVFIQGDLAFEKSWFINAGFSMNRSKVTFERLNSSPVMSQRRSYRNEIAPRITLKKIFNGNFFINTTVARGFSPPTIAELLPSTGDINTDLEAESGWNYEMTLGYHLFKRKLKLEATGFYFKLENALVQRRDISGADFFVNAGEVKQRGVELSGDYYHAMRKGIVDYLTLRSAFTYNAFRYGSFVKGAGDDFTGKKVPSVPGNTLSVLADVQFKKGIYSNITYYSASKIYLNDANTAFADPYHLLGWRLGWKKTLKKKYKLDFYAGADNLLDETYSLGNDINAAANRFYNAAPARNYYAGIAFQLNGQRKN